jgi:universal stress protein E
MKISEIVVGTSLAEGSDAMVCTAVALARRAGASAWLVHAYSPPAFPSDLESADGRWIEEMAKALRRDLTEQARRTGLDALPGFVPDRLRLVMDSPPWALVDLAREVKADLLVVGATAGGALHRIFLGSTADGAIRKASCPVFVVRDEAAFPPARVEIPVDLSPVSADACRRGLDFLDQIGVPVTEVEALFVLHPFEVGGSLHFTPVQVRRFASEELRRFLEANRHAAIPRLTLVRTGYPRDEILTAITERKADLAILGTHGRSGLERLTIGSVTAEVMHQARCNLLIIPPGAGVRSEEGVACEEAKQQAEPSFAADEELAPAGQT